MLTANTTITQSQKSLATGSPEVIAAATVFYQNKLKENYKRTDLMFAILIAIQWIAGVGLSLWLTPLTWKGSTYEPHIHVYMAVFLGGVLSLFPIALVLFQRGHTLNRYVIAISQMGWSAVLIHLSGGRIETHFHVFGSLAFLAFYRDWKILIPATLTIGADHLVRGIYAPQSVFGVLLPSPFRALEHALWVAFEDGVLIFFIIQNLKDFKTMAFQQAQLDSQLLKFRNQSIDQLSDSSSTLVQSTKDIENSLTETSEMVVDISSLINMVSGSVSRQNDEVNLGVDRVNDLLDGVNEADKHSHTQISFVGKASDVVFSLVERNKNISQHLDKAGSISQAISNSSDEIFDAVSKTSSGMKEIANSITKIKEISASITAISDQTNILSMNAAIEAAHAGELGMGFAIVAGEVRNLAEVTAVNAKEITILMKDIESKITSGVKASEQSTEKITLISGLIKESTALIQNIDQMMKEQTANSNEVLASIKAVVEATTNIREIISKQKDVSEDYKNFLKSLLEFNNHVLESTTKLKSRENTMTLAMERISTNVDQNAKVIRQLTSLVDGLKADENSNGQKSVSMLRL